MPNFRSAGALMVPGVGAVGIVGVAEAGVASSAARTPTAVDVCSEPWKSPVEARRRSPWKALIVASSDWRARSMASSSRTSKSLAGSTVIPFSLPELQEFDDQGQAIAILAS